MLSYQIMRSREDRVTAEWHAHRAMELSDEAAATRDPTIRNEAFKHYDRALYYMPTAGIA